MQAPPAVEILPATWRDVRGVWRLEKDCFQADAWGLLEILATLLGPGVRLKASLAGRVVGFVLGELPHSDDSAWIATLGVHPSMQRRGVGRRLLAAAEERLAAPSVKLTVRASNAAARALYIQAGYRPVSKIERYYSDGEQGVVMEKTSAAAS